LSPANVLVIEDNQEYVKSLRRHVTLPPDYQWIWAADARNGLLQALEGDPTLILLDLSLPDVEGLDFLRTLRERGCYAPVILLTPRGAEPTALRGLRLGVRDVLLKPFTAEEMAEAIYAALQEERLASAQDDLVRRLAAANAELERALGDLQMLQEISKEITSLLDLEAVLAQVVKAAVRVADAEEGYLLMCNEEGDELYLRAAQNLGEEAAASFRIPVEDSIAGQVVRSGEPLILTGNLEGSSIKIKTGLLVRSLVAVPLKARGRTLGVLAVDNLVSARTFGERELNLLQTLADYAVIAITNARLYEEASLSLDRQVGEMVALHRISHELSHQADVEALSYQILQQALRALKAEAGAVGWLTAEGHLSWMVEGEPALTRRCGGGQEPYAPCDQVLRTGRPFLQVHPAHSDQVHPDASSDGHQGVAQLIVPIARDGRVIGLIGVERSRALPFSQADQRFLESVAYQAAMGYDHVQMGRQIVWAKSQMETLLQSLAEGVLFLDRDLRIQQANRAVERLTGWDLQTLQGRFYPEVFTPHRHRSALSASETLPARALRENQPISWAEEGAWTIACRNGTRLPVAGVAVPLPEGHGDARSIALIFRDVRAEVELARLRSEFAAIASQALQLPVNNLQAPLAWLLSGELPERLEPEVISLVQTHCLRLHELADEMLQAIRLRQGQAHSRQEPVPLAAVARHVVQQFTLLAPEHHFEVVAPPDLPFALGDGAKVETVLGHLLENAVAYSPPGSCIRIAVEADAARVTLRVQDEGIGIAPEEQEAIFRPFYRVDNEPNRLRYSHGLGLYIARRLIEAQKGRIWVESVPGQGSTFAFDLPRWEASDVSQAFVD